jgi:hypothetical protein
MKTNKWTFLLTCIALLAFTSAVRAQTVITITTSATGVTTSTTNNGTATQPANPSGGFTVAGLFSGGGSNSLAIVGKDLVYFIENTTNSGVVQLEAGALIGQKTHDVGEFANVYLPVGGTNSIFGAGFGGTITVPFLRIPLYSYIESGGGYNIGKGHAIAQAFTGVMLPIPITITQTLTFGVAIGTISDLSENLIAIGGSYTWKF